MSRVLLLLVVTAGLYSVQPTWASQPDFYLQVVPAIVYKVDDPGNAKTSSFEFDIAVICPTDCALTPISASVELSNGRSTVERQVWTTEMLAKIRGVNYRILPDTPVASPTRIFTLPEAFDVRFYFRHPQALAIDSAAVRLAVADAKGRRQEQTLRIPIQYYQQKTSLIVPFRGNGVVGQDWGTNGGHGGYWNAFAIDLRGLDENYAEQKTMPTRTLRLRAGAARSLRPRLERWSTPAMTYPRTRTRERSLTSIAGTSHSMIRSWRMPEIA